MSEVWVTERIVCPQCGGTGGEERRLIEGDDGSLPYLTLVCPKCYGYKYQFTVVSLEDTEFWRTHMEWVNNQILARTERRWLRDTREPHGGHDTD